SAPSRAQRPTASATIARPGTGWRDQRRRRHVSRPYARPMATGRSPLGPLAQKARAAKPQKPIHARPGGSRLVRTSIQRLAVIAAVMSASGSARWALRKSPWVVAANSPARRPVSASNRSRATAYVSHTVATAAAAEGTTALHSVTRPSGQEMSAISHARSGGLLKYPAPFRRGQSQSPRARMSWASSGKRASSLEAKVRAASWTPISAALAIAIHTGPGGHPMRARHVDRTSLGTSMTPSSRRRRPGHGGGGPAARGPGPGARRISDRSGGGSGSGGRRGSGVGRGEAEAGDRARVVGKRRRLVQRGRLAVVLRERIEGGRDRGDQDDRVVVVAIVEEAGEPDRIGRARVGERGQRQESQRQDP